MGEQEDLIAGATPAVAGKLCTDGMCPSRYSLACSPHPPHDIREEMNDALRGDWRGYRYLTTPGK